ncbi:MAG: dodecin [Phenylobacterium sp.]|jgi:flavin-binding protein dodecin|uniref:dodecin n=1 Tax=Phenylobacterium sp. TaxID=1871053 RepID=UPI002A34234A|nr:dodecin [Phenylobacterium sp.]MDD3837136.1 dodecin family protein [Phenylobacterium sp.]MDX9996623.1 dodecin family protein [Phenylobacterium sp.]
MTDHTYGISEIVGSSETSIEDAIQNAISNASENRRSIRWFEVVETRGHVEDNRVKHYQVHIRLGYLIED